MLAPITGYFTGIFTTVRQWHVKNALISERYLGVLSVKTPVYTPNPLSK